MCQTGNCQVYVGIYVGVITGFEAQKRNKKRVNVYIDGEFSLSVSIDEAVGLRKGQTLSDEDIDALQAQDASQRAVDAAARLLSLRPRSAAEVRQNLTRKGIATPVIDEAIERLTTMGYLDDRAFAEFWVKERNASKPLGTRALRYELRQKGIAGTIIDDVLDDQDETATAVEAARKHLRRVRGLTRSEARKKLTAQLARKGFSPSTTREAIQQIFEEVDAGDEPFFREDTEGKDADRDWTEDR